MTESLPTLAAILAGCAALAVLGIVLWRARHPAPAHTAAMAELAQRHTELLRRGSKP